MCKILSDVNKSETDAAYLKIISKCKGTDRYCESGQQQQRADPCTCDAAIITVEQFEKVSRKQNGQYAESCIV